MIPKRHVQQVLGVSVGTFLLVAVCSWVYLNLLKPSPSPVTDAQDSPPPAAVDNTKSANAMEQFQHKMLALFRQDAYYFSLSDAQFYLASYYDYPLLFSVALELGSSLDAEEIPQELRHHFANSRIRLSDNTSVTVRQPGYWWVITDQKRSIPWSLSFTVVKEGDILNVYRNPRDFKEHQLQIDFATLYPQNYREAESDWTPLPWDELREFYKQYLQEHTPRLERLQFRLAAKDRLAEQKQRSDDSLSK